MNILITGAGLIGTNAARHAIDAGHKVVLFDLSPNRDYIEKVVGANKADVVAADMRDLPALLAGRDIEPAGLFVVDHHAIGAAIDPPLVRVADDGVATGADIAAAVL